MQEVIDKVLGGDAEAFRIIVGEHGPAVRAFLASRLTDRSVVDDLAQETFIAAYEDLHGFRRDADFGAWLRGIARHRMLMHLRSAHRRRGFVDRLRARVIEEMTPEATDADAVEPGYRLGRLRKCLDRLPERTRELLEARHVRSEAVKEIAARVRSTVNAISSVLFRGRRLLVECMERQS